VINGRTTKERNARRFVQSAGRKRNAKSKTSKSPEKGKRSRETRKTNIRWGVLAGSSLVIKTRTRSVVRRKTKRSFSKEATTVRGNQERNLSKIKR